MIISRLKLENVGQFRGSVEFDLRPSTQGQAVKPIILFGGKNGAGKTTILNSILLCMYGQSGLKSRLTKLKYEEYLADLIHDPKGYCERPDSASVEVEFSYTNKGETNAYRLVRSWSHQTGKMKETVVVYKGDDVLDSLSAEYWQDFINSIIPLPLVGLFFFDGEQIQSLAETDNNDGLASAIRNLLGLDLVEQLEADLAYIQKEEVAQTLSQKEKDSLKALQQEAKEFSLKENALSQDSSASRNKIDWLDSQIRQKEDRLSQLGGKFAQNRENNIKLLGAKRQKIEEVKSKLRDLAEASFPFSLIPELMTSVKEQLEREKTQKQANAILDYIEIKLPEALAQTASVKGLEKPVMEILRQDLKGKAEGKIIHDFSDSQEHRFFQVYQEALHEVPNQVENLSQQLEKLEEEALRYNREIQQAPSDGSLEEQIQEIRKLNDQLSEAHRVSSKLDEQLRSATFQKEDRERQANRLIDKQSESESLKKKGALMAKTLTALKRYKEQVLAEKVQLLEVALVDAWQALTRKKNFLGSAKIDSKTFEVELFGPEGHLIKREQLSAGEKQMYAVSMLWALGSLSGRPLPVIVDTPLGRLDSDHRTHLVEGYFPNVSHQVVVLSTDTEVDREHYKSLEKKVARTYLLDFCQESKQTKVKEEYFWKVS